MASELAPSYISVTELNRKVSKTLEANRDLRSVWVVGELSNVRPSNSPHLFPRLKDETSEIGLVIWGNVVDTYRELIKEGARVLVLGKVRVFERRGVYQLYVDEVREFGVGELYARFEALKKQLKEQGLFDQKREIPKFPTIVGVVTSPTGAVIQDILRNLLDRYPPIRVIIAPVQVQGEGAARDIAAGIAALNRLVDSRPDVLIVGRGGGSVEDLWAFNEEDVARALFSSRIPTISAVGHQTDFTIADFVADRRAATPTEAAVVAVPDKDAVLEHLGAGQQALIDALADILHTLEERVERDAALLETLDPRGILQRGYSIVVKDGNPIGSVARLHLGDGIDITMRDGEIGATVRQVSRRRA
jgi:exodeoxyribonuclease VII large subunit